MHKQIFPFKSYESFIYLSLKIILCIGFISFLGCKKDEEEKVNPFAACCTHEIQTLQLGNSRYTIPNLITKNEDGINDQLGIFFNGNGINTIDTIISFDIYSDKNELIFTSGKRIISILDFYIWDGSISSGSGSGTKYSGAFRYEGNIKNSSGAIGTISGNACIVSNYCDVMDENVLSCIYGTQHDGSGNFDLDLPTLENCY